MLGAGSSRQLWGSGCSALFGEEKKKTTLRHVLRLTGRMEKRLKIQEGELITSSTAPEKGRGRDMQPGGQGCALRGCSGRQEQRGMVHFEGVWTREYKWLGGSEI